MSDIPDLGIFLPTMGRPGHRLPDVAGAARHAEELGFESICAVDQLVAGTGAPFVESTVALAAAAAVTNRIRLGVGVLILPLRPVVWAAKQLASLQHVSNGRLVLGVGVGGDRHDRSWAAAGVPARERGARTDAALRVLPGLLRGESTVVDSLPGGPEVRLAPGVDMPDVVVGGSSDAAIARVLATGGGWFLLPGSADDMARERARVEAAADAAGRPTPPLTASMLTAINGDDSLPHDEQIVAELTDPDGVFAMPAEAVPSMLVTGDVDTIASRLAGYGHSGANRVVVTVAAGDWFRQAELLAEARARLG